MLLEFSTTNPNISKLKCWILWWKNDLSPELFYSRAISMGRIPGLQKG